MFYTFALYFSRINFYKMNAQKLYFNSSPESRHAKSPTKGRGEPKKKQKSPLPKPKNKINMSGDTSP